MEIRKKMVYFGGSERQSYDKMSDKKELIAAAKEIIKKYGKEYVYIPGKEGDGSYKLVINKDFDRLRKIIKKIEKK